MKEFKVAILGATGAVGMEMIKVLQERKFPVSQLKLLAGARSAGSKLSFCGEDIVVDQAGPDSFKGMDIVLGAAENDISRAMWPAIKEAGALYIDNSSEFRLAENVPLVVPEVNKEDAYKHQGLIANPNCVTIIAAAGVAPISAISPIQTMVASSYQAVSGAGKAGLEELENQTKAYAAGEPMESKAFAHQIAFNLIPKIGGVNELGYSSEEMKLLNEGRKIMHLPDLKVCCTCVRVPVLRSHAISIDITTERPVSVEEAKAALAKAEGVKLFDDPNQEMYPMPLNTSDQDLVWVGRVRKDLIHENGLSLWVCGDQIRKGAATNAIQIAELFK